MNREMKIEAVKTYATIENARKAVAKTGDEVYRHFYMQNDAGRWFPVFPVADGDLGRSGLHFRWNVI